jgi:hypothetical protein
VVVKEVINHLKCRTEVLPIPSYGILSLTTLAGDDGTDGAADSKSRASCDGWS